MFHCCFMIFLQTDFPSTCFGPEVDQLSVAAKEKKPGTANSWASNKTRSQFCALPQKLTAGSPENGPLKKKELPALETNIFIHFQVPAVSFRGVHPVVQCPVTHVAASFVSSGLRHDVHTPGDKVCKGSYWDSRLGPQKCEMAWKLEAEHIFLTCSSQAMSSTMTSVFHSRCAERRGHEKDMKGIVILEVLQRETCETRLGNTEVSICTDGFLRGASRAGILSLSQPITSVERLGLILDW